jgi:poly-gamma-glutamate capsule biosynthesis protein CapA/YwtB (metallophosphatase superfamily)
MLMKPVVAPESTAMTQPGKFISKVRFGRVAAGLVLAGVGAAAAAATAYWDGLPQVLGASSAGLLPTGPEDGLMLTREGAMAGAALGIVFFLLRRLRPAD